MKKTLWDRWGQFSTDQQILMIGSEISRLISGIQKKGTFQENKLCIERAFELTNFTVLLARPNLQKELLRWRNLLGNIYLMQESKLNQQTHYLKALLKALLLLNGKSALCQVI